MRSIGLALGASLTWGFADFFGPLKGRTLGALRVLFYVQVGGLVAIALDRRDPRQGPADPARSSPSRRRSRARSASSPTTAAWRSGAMSIVAPIAGISAVVPVAFGIATGDRPSTWQWLGIAARARRRLPGLAGAGPRRQRLAAGVGLALLAAHRLRRLLPADARRRERRLLVGVAHLPDDVHGGDPRSGCDSRGRHSPSSRLQVPILALIGIGDMLGNLLFAAASTSGLVSITSVLASLYPIVTVDARARSCCENASRDRRRQGSC